MRRPLIYSAAFVRAAKRIRKRQLRAALAIRETLYQLEADAFDTKLRSHKLTGELNGCWSCSAGYDLRIVFEFVTVDKVEMIRLLSVGTHDEVY